MAEGREEGLHLLVGYELLLLDLGDSLRSLGRGRVAALEDTALQDGVRIIRHGTPPF